MGFAICNSLVSKAWQVKKYDRRNPRPLNELGSHNERCEAAEETPHVEERLRHRRLEPRKALLVSTA